MIFVVGAARSGTSMVTRMLEQCGAQLGGVNSLVEHRVFKEDWIYPQLQKRGFDRFGQMPVPDEAINDADPAEVRRQVAPMIADATAVKDVKMVHFWPIFAKAFPEAVWLIVWRDPKRVARSCMKTSFMKAYRTEEAWEDWANTYHIRCAELRDSVPDRTFDVDINELRKGHDEGISGALDAVGLEWDKKVVRRIFKANRWSG